MASLEQFFVAVACGDAPTLAAFFTHRASAPSGTIEIDDREQRPGHEWLRPFTQAHRYGDFHSLIGVAIRSEYIEVLAWLFSADAIAAIGEQPLVVAVAAACRFAACLARQAVLELLLASSALELLTASARQILLDQLLCLFQSADNARAVRLLTAHGARVNGLEADGVSLALQYGARRADLPMVDALVRDGVAAVGARVLDNVFSGASGQLRPLLEYGLLPVVGGWPLQRAVSQGHLERATFWIAHCFADVDVRLIDEQTPLMQVTHEEQFCQAEKCRRLEMTQLLLTYGASVSAIDVLGNTPLHHAVGCCNAEIVRLLLESGADPNAPSIGNWLPVDALDLTTIDKPLVAAQLEYLLQHGADPYLLGGDNTTAEERLAQTSMGKEFITRHQQYFLRK